MLNGYSKCHALYIQTDRYYSNKTDSFSSKIMTNANINLLFQEEKWLNTTIGQTAAEKIFILKSTTMIFIVF